VNLASAWLLHNSDHDHAHDLADQSADKHAASEAYRRGHHQDSNLRAAYVHVLAVALTSVLAIVGLTAAWALGWTFIDPAVGLVGVIVILSWALSLIRTVGRVLLDTVPDSELARRIRERIETGGDLSIGICGGSVRVMPP
jgi:cation diffusion facilitator family transporter